jgi:hypothetical protein
MKIHSGKAVVFAYSVVSAVYFWLSLNLPLSIQTHQVYDDALFILNGMSLIRGDWLGDYSNLTLVKGPVFPMFLAINNFLGTPMPLVAAVLYFAGCFAFVRALRHAGMPAGFRFGLYVVLLFQPSAMPMRVIRENIYTSLTLLVLAAIILVVSNKNPYRNSALGGLALAALWMTREEGPWIIPGLLVLLAVCVFLYTRGTYKDWSPKGTLLLAMVFAGCFLAPIQAISFINLYNYGYYGITDIKGRHFKQALKSLQSVVFGEPLPFQPVPASSRKEIYKHSPAFAELQGILESEGNPWRSGGKTAYPQVGNDYAGGWFLWAFRDAVAKAGYYKNPMAAEDFYARVAQEIEAAQQQGLLPKASSPVPYMPPISRENMALIPEASARALGFTTHQKIGIPVLPNSSSDHPVGRLKDFRKFLGNPKTVPSDSEITEFQIKGWYYSNAGDWLVLSGTDALDSPLPRLPSPGLAKRFNDPASGFNRFSFTASGQTNQVLKSGNHSIPVQSLIAQKKGRIPLCGGVINFEKVGDPMALFAKDLPLRAALSLKGTLVQAYHFLVPPMAYGGLACMAALPFLIYFSRGRAACNPLLLFAGLAFAILYFVRLALLVAIDVTSFPAAYPSYLGPAFAMVPAFSFTMFSAVYCSLAKWRKTKP